MSNAENKKILIINTTFKKGGAARVARDLFDNQKNGCEVFFAYGRGDREADQRTFKFGNRLEMLIQIFLVRFLGLEGWGCYFATRKLIKFIKKEKFDLIHLHNLHGYYVNFFTLIRFIQKQKIPVVWTIHDEWPVTWLPAHSLGCEHCKTGVGKCRNTYGYPLNYLPLFARYMLKKKEEVFSGDWNSIIICPSQWLQADIKSSFLGKFDIRVISNGIDTDLFRPADNIKHLREKYGLPLDKKIIIYSASSLQDKSKGIDCLLDAARQLQDKDYLFLCIGKGNLENSGNIRTMGYVYDQRQYAEILACADLFCFTSVAETFLLAAAEALACGVPVAGFDIPVVREIISQDVGELVQQGDRKALAQAIVRLLDNGPERSAKGERGRQLIASNYSQKLFFEKYFKLYNGLLQ